MRFFVPCHTPPLCQGRLGRAARWAAFSSAAVLLVGMQLGLRQICLFRIRPGIYPCCCLTKPDLPVGLTSQKSSLLPPTSLLDGNFQTLWGPLSWGSEWWLLPATVSVPVHICILSDIACQDFTSTHCLLLSGAQCWLPFVQGQSHGAAVWLQLPLVPHWTPYWVPCSFY